MKRERCYFAVDLKSFYASVECVDRNMNPLTTNLVVADISRTEKTICLAVSPALKRYGIPGRARLYQVVQLVKAKNEQRLLEQCKKNISGGGTNSSAGFYKKSADATVIDKNPFIQIDYIVAPPRMRRYMEVSTQIYNVYLKFFSADDIHVYSIDEVFIDVTPYLEMYKKTPEVLAASVAREILYETGITATVGIGTNLFLCKVAMDIVAKHVEADENGVRIARLDEMSYRKLLWDHKPITDFWRVGSGYARKLAANGMYTMGDIARCSIGENNQRNNASLLFRLFGVNAELLIDHAWGWEPCTISEIKAYRPQSNSLSSGQVLKKPYPFEKARLVLKEMADQIALDMTAKHVTTNHISIFVGYDTENFVDGCCRCGFPKTVVRDHYGRSMPKPANGSVKLRTRTANPKELVDAFLKLFDRIVVRQFTVRRITVAVCNLEESTEEKCMHIEQLSLFVDYESKAKQELEQLKLQENAQRIQETTLKIKGKYGKNALFKGINMLDGATACERNAQVGGHRA